MKQALQKFTKQKIIKNFLNDEKINLSDYQDLCEADKQVVKKNVVERLNTLKGDEKDEFLNKIDEILPKSVKNQLWENNHFQITCAISKLVEEFGKMPTKNQIAQETGISRTTIHKHLKNYSDNPLYQEEIQKFKFMADRVLAKVLKLAVKDNGDIKAARLFFEVVGYNGQKIHKDSSINTQNNYIQINQTRLSQTEIMNLAPEQLILIESIIKGNKKTIIE